VLRERPGVADARSADLQLREPGLECLRGEGVELEVLVVGAGPAVRAVVRLVPDFPVPNRVPEAVGPPLRVMPDDADAGSRPLLEVLRGPCVPLRLLVLDALAEPVN